ncbi:MAG TPA: hypothetical protein PLV50_04675 [Smithella sp.]|nr:hypothetical protein [Smithella sp.]MDM7987490.1 hypothetical protein [Smithella sp.]HNY50179.1 hypothetical protein [Smithella sp.]HOG89807.1 hypothetical protein [Smithella sp.]HOU51724.1 hypothetical protein [Smithella sp.]
MSRRVNAEAISNDKRILSRKLMQGEISDKDLQALLKKLPDVADNAEEVSLNENQGENKTESQPETTNENAS